MTIVLPALFWLLYIAAMFVVYKYGYAIYSWFFVLNYLTIPAMVNEVRDLR